MISQSIPILRINEIPYCTWKECLQIDVMFLRKVFIFQSCNHRKSMTYRQNYVRKDKVRKDKQRSTKQYMNTTNRRWTPQALTKGNRFLLQYLYPSCKSCKISWFIVHVCTENQNKTFHYRKDCSKGLS
jgi:hypothetical protein